MLTFALESWEQYYNDPSREELWQEHYSEIAEDKSMPMGPDVPYFQFLDTNGMLQVLTVRSRGVMVGYCLIVVRRHTHYDSLCAFEDSYFLRKSERKGTAGVRLIAESLRHLRKRGVKRVFFMSKCSKELSKLFKHFKFRHCDEVWTLSLSEAS